MQKLKCPSCRQLFALTPWQSDFVKQATAKKMAMIILECQACHDNFSMDPLRAEVGTPLLGAPRKTADRSLSAAEKKRIIASLTVKGIELPARYRSFLSKCPPDVTLKLKGREWTLYGVDELRKPVRIDRHRTLQIRELGVWAKVLKTVLDGAPATEDQRGDPFPLSRLARGISIGCENEDVLFLDPSDGHSVWCLFPSEGGTVALLEKRFTSFMTRLENRLGRAR